MAAADVKTRIVGNARVGEGFDDGVFVQAEDGIRDWSVTEFRRVLFGSGRFVPR